MTYPLSLRKNDLVYIHAFFGDIFPGGKSRYNKSQARNYFTVVRQGVPVSGIDPCMYYATTKWWISLINNRQSFLSKRKKDLSHIFVIAKYQWTRQKQQRIKSLTVCLVNNHDDPIVIAKFFFRNALHEWPQIVIALAIEGITRRGHTTPSHVMISRLAELYKAHIEKYRRLHLFTQ